MKILQINSSINSGSTGRITEDIGCVLLENRHESYIAYGRNEHESKSVKVKIGGKWNVMLHYLESSLFDRHAFSSRIATRRFLKKLDEIAPDAIGLHNLHGYYLNIEMLFNYIKRNNIPVIWTLFDCWAFTGHCSYFDNINCEKWKSECHNCPKINYYPKSYILDNSKTNFRNKSAIFNGVNNLEIIVHSNWLSDLVKQSYLANYRINIVRSGVDVCVFKPTQSELKTKHNLTTKKIILGCASIWDERKGIADFIKLSSLLTNESQIILIGLTDNQIKLTNNYGIIGIKRTESTAQLAEYYSSAHVFVNPTYQDNFPTTNLEALACGTPVVTYNTGGSPEAIDDNTGRVVEKGNLEELVLSISEILEMDKCNFTKRCRNRALELFDKNKVFDEYIRLYQKVMKNSK